MRMFHVAASFLVCLFFVSDCVCFGEAIGEVFYVSTRGRDVWSGRLSEANESGTDGPFATLERARDEIRRLKTDEGLSAPVTVYVRGGDYELSQTFELGAGDGGTKDGPIVYRAYQDEQVRLVGGRKVSGFVPVKDGEILRRLGPTVRTKVVQADLKAIGITDYGKLLRRGFGRGGIAGLELFYQHRPMTLARYPNKGWLTITTVPAGSAGGKFGYDSERPGAWGTGEDIQVHGFWTQDWADSYEDVAAIDTQAKVITTVSPHGVYGYTAGKRFYFLNVLEELDLPGEWHLDRRSGILYFLPDGPIEGSDAVVSVIETAVLLKNASYITIAGMTIECTRGTAVEINGGNDNVAAGCIIRNVGNRGVSISGGSNNGVQSCDIYETSDGGIGLSGGDRRTLEPCGNFADNNHIHDYSRWCYTYRPAVGVHGVGIRVSHNLLHDGPHNAIQLSGNEDLIEYNEIHDVCTESDDVGAFYMGRDWTMRGNVVRYNFFHHIHSAAEQYRNGSRVVYLDDAASGTTIHGNVFYKAGSLCAVNVGGGRDNIVTNNIFVDCVNGVLIDTRGLGWANKYIVEGGGWAMYKKLADVAYDKPPYSERYPKLASILKDNPNAPCGNVLKNNICVGGKFLNMPADYEHLVAQEDNLTEVDPLFIDREKMDFQLRRESPAWKSGFERIPFEKMGLYRDEYHRSIPARKGGA